MSSARTFRSLCRRQWQTPVYNVHSVIYFHDITKQTIFHFPHITIFKSCHWSEEMTKQTNGYTSFHLQIGALPLTNIHNFSLNGKQQMLSTSLQTTHEHHVSVVQCCPLVAWVYNMCTSINSTPYLWLHYRLHWRKLIYFINICKRS